MHTVLKAARPCKQRREQRGMSLVEMMVGVAIGLFIVAAAATLVSGQLADNRSLLVETQVQQDLRATMDTITRQLRRAGAVGNSATNGMAPRDGTQAGGSRLTICAGNADCTLMSTATPSEVDFYFVLGEFEQGPFGYQLDHGVIKTNSGRGGWQEMTDANSIFVDSLQITNAIHDSTTLPCPKSCTSGTIDCWPKLQVRTIKFTITAHSIADAAVSRTISGDVRLRNDRVVFTDTANPNQICPA
jgi:type IV pilus assembly protein PilW